MLSHQPHLTATALLACTTGCSPVPEYEPLSEARYESVEIAYDSIQQGAILHGVIASHADDDAFADSQGTVGIDAYQQEYKTAVDLAGSIVDAKRVVGYTDMRKDEKGEIKMQAMYFEDERGPAIGINLAVENAFHLLEHTPSTLAHEAAHASYGDHTGNMAHPAIESFDVGSYEFCEAVRTKKDVPYMVTQLSNPVEAYLRLVNTIWSTEYYIVPETTTDPRLVWQAVERIESYQAQTKGEFVSEAIDYISEKDIECLGAFGITEQVLFDAFMEDTSVYEPMREKWDEEIGEILEEIKERYYERRAESSESSHERRQR